MNSLKAPSLQSLMDSDRASNDSQYTDYNIQLDLEELDDQEYALPTVDTLPTLESVLHDLDSEFGDNDSDCRISSTATPTPSEHLHPPPHPTTSRIGSMLRHSTLHSVSNQIGSAADRVNAGLASSVAVDQMIAVGTSHGHILCHDNAQVLRWCCQEYTQQGAVSSLAFNADNSRLLAGFARGTIVMIDTLSGDALRTLSDAITPNTGVLSLKWTDRPATALCLDSGGSVWSLSFTRRLGIRSCESRCLFSGARGEVCAIEPLQLLPDDPHPMKAHSLVAMATLSKFFVVVLRPRLKVVKVHAVTGPPDTLPLISWHVVLIESADASRRVDPVLAAARGNQLFFHQVFVHGNRVNLIPLRHIVMGYELLAMKWLGSKHIVTCDRSEVLHLIDVRSNKELEQYDMGRVGMVYNSAQFKGLATGGNVSPALALAGTFACYNSLSALENQLYVLGSRSLHVVSVRPWSDRISHLSANGKWTEAVNLAIEGYRGATGRPMRQEMAKNRILQLVEEYMVSTSKTPENCLDAVMACLVEIREQKLLWEELWDRLDNTDYFISLLTAHIERGTVTTLSTPVAQTLCEYWAHISTARLEDILLRLDWQCLDLHQVLTLAKRTDMFRVQMHLFSKALGDFSLALTDLIPRLDDATALSHLGNHLLVYVSSCLAGRGYPAGELLPEVAKTAKHEVLRTLTATHSSRAVEGEAKYPYLRQLLHFDTRETLNVVSLAFEEPEFAGDLGMLQRQRLVNILLEVLTVEEGASWSQIGALMAFVSAQLANRLLPPDPVLIDSVFKFVTRRKGEEGDVVSGEAEETVREHVERENAWLDLLAAGDDYVALEVAPHELLRLAKAAGCYRVLEHLYEQSRSFDEILDCYLWDKTRHGELFAYLRRYADEPEREVYPQIAANLIMLLEIGARQLAKVVCECYADRVRSLIGVLDRGSVELFRFMEALSGEGVAFEAEDCELYLELLCRFGGEIDGGKGGKIKEEIVERFLQHPGNRYRLDVALATVERYGLEQASVYLLEKRGDFKAAFTRALRLLKGTMEEGGIREGGEAQALRIAGLCVRASEGVAEEGQRVELWTMLLDVVLSRADLAGCRKQVLHMASGHMDLQRLVQLVLEGGQRGGREGGRFGDIRHLLMSMLANSRYESQLLGTTARVLGTDLHRRFVGDRERARCGLAIRTVACVECGHKLLRGRMGDDGDKEEKERRVVVFGSCGHAVHAQCAPEGEQVDGEEGGFSKCPRCRKKAMVASLVRVAQPKINPFERFVARRGNGEGLQLGAPTRLK